MPVWGWRLRSSLTVPPGFHHSPLGIVDADMGRFQACAVFYRNFEFLRATAGGGGGLIVRAGSVDVPLLVAGGGGTVGAGGASVGGDG